MRASSENCKSFVLFKHKFSHHKMVIKVRHPCLCFNSPSSGIDKEGEN